MRPNYRPVRLGVIESARLGEIGSVSLEEIGSLRFGDDIQDSGSC